MNPLLVQLQGGDRRSIGQSERVAAEVLRDGQLFPALAESLSNGDPLVRMRGADAMEKITRERPEWLAPHKDFLIQEAGTTTQTEVRWHLAQMLPRLPLKPADARRVADLMIGYCNDRSSILKALAMQALFDLAERHPRLRPEVLTHIRELVVIGTPAVKARGRKLLKLWGEKL